MVEKKSLDDKVDELLREVVEVKVRLNGLPGRVRIIELALLAVFLIFTGEKLVPLLFK